MTARVQLTLEADGHTACVPVFVQPHSKQECLLDTSATQALGLTFLDSNNEPLLKHFNPLLESQISRVQLVQAPGRMGKFVEVNVLQGCAV